MKIHSRRRGGAGRLSSTLLAPALLTVGLSTGACSWMDGPLAMLPGGPLEAGELVEAPNVDWTPFAAVEEIEFESGGRSRTTWLVVHEGEAFVPCSLDFPPFKTWHERALEAPEAMVRVEGKRYPRTLERVDDETLKSTLFDQVRAKYPNGPSDSADGMWFFRLAPRA